MSLNIVLSRWLSNSGIVAPALDCVGCKKVSKCCDYQPFLPNFILGALIERGVKLHATTPQLWLPIGLVPPQRVREQRNVCVFFNENRSCSIYQFRPAECSTYFCEGMSDSHKILSQRGFEIETSVVQMALAHLGYSARAIGEQVDRLNDPQTAQESVAHEPNASLMDLYARAWTWARHLTQEEVRSWV